MKPDILLIWPNRPDQMAALDAAYTMQRYDLADDTQALLTKIADKITAVQLRS